MNNYKRRINSHYRRPDLESEMTTAIENAGMDKLSHKDTAPFDEFHIKGRKGTRELAELAGFCEGMHILDLGCGVGGPARTLAAEYGCTVTGVDIMEEFCEAAAMLTKRIGLENQVRFLCGDMSEIQFENETFDGAWAIHTVMNIENKAEFFRTVYHVLVPEGRLAIYEICEGLHFPPLFPVPWANASDINFLIPQDQLRQIIQLSGFKCLIWKDVTTDALNWYQKRVSQNKPTPKPDRAGPEISLLMGPTTREKMKNVLKNMREDRIRVIQAVFEK